MNRAGRELVGRHTDEETLGRPLHDFSPEQDRSQAQEIVRSVRSLGSWEGETTVQHVETGESIPVSVSAFQVNRSSDGRPLALAAVLRDLRARASIESALAVRVQEQRAIAELGRLALTLPLTDLMDEAVQLITARYPMLVAGVLHRLPDGTQSQMVASSLAEARSVVVASTRAHSPGVR